MPGSDANTGVKWQFCRRPEPPPQPRRERPWRGAESMASRCFRIRDEVGMTTLSKEAGSPRINQLHEVGQLREASV